MRQVPSLSRRQLLSGTLAATLGLSGCNVLQGSGSGVLEDSADGTAMHTPMKLVLTETTTHSVTTVSSTSTDRASSTETTSSSTALTTATCSSDHGGGGSSRSTTTSTTTTPTTESTSTTTPESGGIVSECDGRHFEDVAAPETYDAIEWHPGGTLLTENGAVLELIESTS